MLDRVPKYPGRVRLTPVPGEENLFDLTRADEPTQYGTPLNTATLLKHQTAALFGLGADAVPDDVLAYLGQYNQHWWWRKATTTQTRYDEVRTLYGKLLSLGNTSLHSAITVTYSAEIEIASNLAVSLKSPKTHSIDRYGNGNVLVGNYLQVGSAIYYVPSGASLNVIRNSDNETLTAYYLASVVYTVTAFSYEVPVGEVDYVHSSDRNAYPDSGEIDGYEWQYLGVPFENAVTAPKIETGSYVGTGKCGVRNKNTLTFGFEPKMVIVHQDATMMFNSNGGLQSTLFWVKGVATQYNGNTSNDVIVNFTQSGNTFSYYITSTNTGNANFQMNASGKTYHYLAIG